MSTSIAFRGKVEPGDSLAQGLPDSMKMPRILCPACSWNPQPASRWSCVPRCGTVWNTFATGGLCPGCGVRWPRTQCLACGIVSPHRDWYRDPDDDKTPTVHRDLEVVERA